jgi:hypothetical protein
MGRLGGNRDKSPGLLPRSGKLMSFATGRGLALNKAASFTPARSGKHSSNMCAWIENTTT